MYIEIGFAMPLIQSCPC